MIELHSIKFEFSQIQQVADFNCGDSPFEYAVAEWIKSDRAIKSIRDRGTEVWLYYEADSLVGYGSLGATRRKWLPPNGNYQNLSIIPSLAVQTEFQCKPDSPPRYSHLILGDLISKAREHRNQLLVLYVHVDNTRAIKFYEKFDFKPSGYQDDHGYTPMYHRLPDNN